MKNLILAIDTSCDETSAAVTSGRKILSNVISSQINLHKKYGGVYPALAKRAHQERIDPVIREALKRAQTEMEKIVAIAVTYGPGLAIALEVGINKAKEISSSFKKPLIGINHMEGHLYSPLAQNKNGKPKREIIFPALALLVSGGHTELVLMKNHGQYQVLGQTLDDACGEALDKAAKIIKLGYPGGPIIEKLAERTKENKYPLHPSMKQKDSLDFSYSGLKTQFLYLVQKMNQKEFNQNILQLAASFQLAAFEQLIRKTASGIKLYAPKTILCGGGVMANQRLRKDLRKLAKKNKLPIFFPPFKKLVTDNAAMIGVAAGYKLERKEFVKNLKELDREPRLSL